MALPLTDEDLLITGQLQGKIAGFSRKDVSPCPMRVECYQPRRRAARLPMTQCADPGIVCTASLTFLLLACCHGSVCMRVF